MSDDSIDEVDRRLAGLEAGVAQANNAQTVAGSLSRGNFRLKLVIGGVLVIAAMTLMGLGTYYATRTLRTVPDNSERIETLESSVAARCAQDHRTTVALLSLTELMNRILDAARRPNPTPEEAERVRIFRAETDRLIDQTNRLIIQGDCDPKEIR